MRLLNLNAELKLKEYSKKEIEYATKIVREQAVKLAIEKDSLSERILKHYDIVYIPIVADILEGKMSKSDAESYSIRKLKEYTKNL